MENKKMDKSLAKKFFIRGDLADSVDFLLKAQKAGENVYTEFNGHLLYSADVTVDSAYLAVTGRTKAECDALEEEQHRKYQEEKEKSIKAIPGIIEKGKAFIPAEKHEKWENFVTGHIEFLHSYGELILMHSITVMEALDNDKSLDDVKDILSKQNHSGMSYHSIISIVENYSEKGEGLVEALTKPNYEKKIEPSKDNQKTDRTL